MGTFQASEQSDRKKTPDQKTYRFMTLDEIKALRPGDHPSMKLNNGNIGTVKVNGEIKRWKREPDRVEVPVKYGMYECTRLDAGEAMRRLVVEVTP